MKLSKQAIQDLRFVIRKKYGNRFDDDMSDEEINQFGLLILTIVSESLKI